MRKFGVRYPGSGHSQPPSATPFGLPYGAAMTNHYTHLTPEERAAAMLALAQGDSLRAIARHLGIL